MDARRDVLLGEERGVVVARPAGLLGVDADDVEVEGVHVAGVAGERLDPVELGHGLVVGRELPLANRAVGFQLVELDERDRGQDVREVGLVARDGDVVERAARAAHQPKLVEPAARSSRFVATSPPSPAATFFVA